MRRLMLLALGAGAGYVMGTRAGRGRYLEMKNAWDRAVNEGSLGQVGRKLGETRIGETLGMKGQHSGSSSMGTSGTSYGAGSTWGSGSTGSSTTGGSYTTGTQQMAGDAGTSSMSDLMDVPETSESGSTMGSTYDLRDSADDNARGLT